MARKPIHMTDDEMWAFLGDHYIATLGTIGPSGAPHLVTVFYHADGTTVHLTSYRTAQKAVNLGRNPAASILVEVPTPYSEIKGVLLRGTMEITTDAARIEETMRGTAATLARIDPEIAAVSPQVDIPSQAKKRVGLSMKIEKAVTWDHSKLGAGVY